MSKLTFPLGPFIKYEGNPILEPQGDDWEAKDVFNPTAVVKDGKVCLLYRAEDHSGQEEWHGTSRIGLAISEDGINFERLAKPVLDVTEPYETPGGVEDPRVTQLGDTYYLTYTAFDGHNARLALATSKDLIHWEKHGLLFPEWNGVNEEGWSKSGAIVPQKIHGRYVMYFGDTDIYIAYSEDGIHWTPSYEPVMRVTPDPDAFDSALIEPGPAPVVTQEGILLIYNAARKITEQDDRSYGQLRYSAGQVLFDLNNPEKVIKRTPEPFLVPDHQDEKFGQVDNVVFIEGMVEFKGRYFLYFGMADSKIGIAVWDPEEKKT